MAGPLLLSLLAHLFAVPAVVTPPAPVVPTPPAPAAAKPIDTGPGPQVKLPPLSMLAAVVKGGDDVEIERVGRRLGAARLLRAALGARRAERLAALRALPMVDGAWAELTPLAKVVGDAEDEIAEAAARTVRRIAEHMAAESLSAETVYAEEIPSDVPRTAARALWDVAARREVRAQVRADTLLAAAALGRIAHPGTPSESLVTLLSDEEPAVRRAAVESLETRGAGAGLLERSLGDPDPGVAAAAGASLCAGVQPVASKARSEKVAAALAEPARARIRALAVDDAHVSATDRLDLIPCLRAFAAPEDSKLLDRLARARDPAIKRRATLYGGR